MASNEVKLLGSWQSPFAFRARIALNIKSVAYDFQQEEVLTAKSNLLLQSNPVHQRIPVLIHNGRPICESLIIVQYIDEVWASGPTILPSDPHDRATARFWTSYIDDTWFKHLQANLLSQGEDARRKAHDETSKGLLLLEAECSRGENFFRGCKIGYVDVALGCFLPLISVIEKECNMSLIDECKTPKLLKWAQRFCANAAVKDILPGTDELLCEFYRFKGSVTKEDLVNEK